MEDQPANVWPLTTRDYEARDGSVIIEIDREFQRENGRGTPERPYLEPPDYNDIEGVYHHAGGAFWVVEEAGDGVVAFGGVLRIDDATVRLRRFRVRLSWRRRGLATLLLRRAERFCPEHGYSSITLGVEEDNDAALTFYRKHGYVEVGESSRHHGVREIEFAKELG